MSETFEDGSVASARYSGNVDFDDWNPRVSDMREAGMELQATFVNNDDAVFRASSDGLNVGFQLVSLSNQGEDCPPSWTATIEEICMGWYWSDPGERRRAQVLAAELRRVAGLLDHQIAAWSSG